MSRASAGGLLLLLSTFATVASQVAPHVRKVAKEQTLGDIAEDYGKELKPNMTLIVPLSNWAWPTGVENTRKMLGGKVAACVLFSPKGEVETDAFGRMANTLSKQLGGEKAMFIGAVLDAESDTIGDDSLSLPHILLLLPNGKRKTWAEWVPNMDPTYAPDRVKVVTDIAEWVTEHLDECADSGECHEVINAKAANMVRRKIQEDLRQQAGTRQAYAQKQTISVNRGKVHVDKEEHVAASKLDASKPMKGAKKKKRRRSRRGTNSDGMAKDEV